MKIIYFDICAIPLFLMILFVCHSRRMIRGNANQLFLTLVLLSLFSALADLGMEIADNAAPLSETGRLACGVCTYVYLILRNATNAVLLLFLLELTKTTFLLKNKWVRLAFCLPYAGILILLAQNPFTHSAFTITAEVGYVRGPLMLAFYGIALIYGLVGLAYCIYSRRYLPRGKWISLLTVYILVHLAVLVQFFRPEILVEMYCTALAEMLIMLSVMRPEERMDSEVGMLSWASYQTDLRNILLSGEHVQIVVIRMLNSREIRSYLGDHRYNRFLASVAAGIRAMRWDRRHRIELYFERPGTVYLIAEADGTGAEDVGERLLAEVGDRIRQFSERGARFEPRVCLIRCPDDLDNAKDILSLGHMFQRLDNSRQTAFR